MSTLSTPFIYLKSSKGKNAPKKKLWLPKSMAQLFKSAQKLFKDFSNIKSILNEEGKFIRSIEEVKPGATYTISDMDPNLIPEPPASDTAKIQISTKSTVSGNPMTPTLITIQTNSKDNEPIIGKSPTKQNAKNSSLKTISSTTSKLSPAPPSLQKPLLLGAGYQIMGANSSLVLDESTEDSDYEDKEVSHASNFNPNSKRKSLIKEPRNNTREAIDNSEDDEFAQNTNQPITKRPLQFRPNQKYMKQGKIGGTNTYGDTTETTPKKKHRRHRHTKGQNDNEINEYYDSDEEKQIEQEEQELKEILEKFDLGISEKLIENIPHLKSLAPFVRKSADLERIQLLNYVQHETRDTMFLNEMQQYVRKAFLSQTHSVEGFTSFYPRIIITGGKGTGKTTLLNVARDELYLHIACCQLQKKLLVINIDGTDIRSNISDLLLTYAYFIDKTFDALVKSYPNITPYVGILKRHFISCLTSPTSPLLSQTIIDNFGRLTDKLNDLGRETNDAVHTKKTSIILSNAVAFPIMLAQIFQMKPIFVIDNIDLTDVQLDADDEFCLASDLLHFVLNMSSFIVACKNESDFYAIFGATQDANILSRSIILPTADIVKTTDNNSKLLLTIEGAPKPVQMSFDICGGCPAFCRQWVEIQKLCGQAEKLRDEFEKEAEMTTAVIPFVRMVMDSRELKVLSVKRSN